MGDKREKLSILKTLTVNNLKEICKKNNLKGYSGTKKELAKFIVDNLEISLDELKDIAGIYQMDKLLGKIRDCRDYFLNKRVAIRSKDKTSIIVDVGEHRVIINNLGKEDFSYIGDDKCADYLYQVKKGKTSFCKHYAAAIAQLVYEKELSSKDKINYIEGQALKELLEIVNQRKRHEGEEITQRDIEGDLKKLNTDFLVIARQNRAVARQKYHDEPENVFEELVNRAFLLLDFDTISQRSGHGWDIVLIAGRAMHPYFIVVECKTAVEGTYDYLVKKPDYLFTLKKYCTDLFRDKLVGAYKSYAKYMILVAPDFPQEIEQCCRKFKEITGLQLSFLPAFVLLKMVNKYRKTPILNHDWIEPLFQKEKLINEKDIDEIFSEVERQIDSLSDRLCKRLRERFHQFSQISGDAAFIKLDMKMLSSVLEDIISEMPELVIPERKGIVDYINIEHDYFEIWERILKKLGKEFIDILKMISFSQVKNTELKEDLLKLLNMK
ncbi:hypothetical protein ES703_87366 [subsurface metagenome]